MNIQCQQCGTSYAVADEKVRGRLMKVRCKSCSEVIRVDGTLLGAADGSSAPPQLIKPATGKAPMSKPPSLSRPDTDGAVWHITVGDGTQGPYTLDELREYYAQGSVMLDTLVYREGFDAWRPAGEVPELAAASTTQNGALAFAGGVSMGSDPFGEQRRPQSSIQSPRVSAAEMLDENASREHTVQFSVDQIRALSSVSQPVSHVSAASSGGGSSRMSFSSGSAGYSGYASPNAGYAGGDGSGLIDVRKLAELHRAMTEEKPVHAQNESSSLLPATGSYAHTLAPLSLPLPPAAAHSGIDGKTKLIAGLAAFGMVLAAAVGVLALTRPQPQLRSDATATAQPVGSAPTAAVAEEEEAAKPAEEAKAEAPEAAAVAADTTADDSEPATASRSSGSKRSSGKHSSSGSSGKSKAKAVDADEEEPVAKAGKPEKEKLSAKDSIDDLLNGDGPSKPAKGKNSAPGASIDDLLDSAVAGASKKNAPPKVEEKAPSSSLPAQPGRDEMLASLKKAAAKASKCKGPGVATAQIQIAGSSGKATSVKVTGAEGPAAGCVEKAVRSTPFPKFQKDSFEVKFPFKLGA